eukprot:scaffold229870_cov14-Prasinocladus_malaysianus.AAC.2
MPRILDNIHDVRTSDRERTNRTRLRATQSLGDDNETPADAPGNDDDSDDGDSDDEWDIRAVQKQSKGPKGISPGCLEELLESIANTEGDAEAIELPPAKNTATNDYLGQVVRLLEEGNTTRDRTRTFSSCSTSDQELCQAAPVHLISQEAPTDFQKRWDKAVDAYQPRRVRVAAPLADNVHTATLDTSARLPAMVLGTTGATAPPHQTSTASASPSPVWREPSWDLCLNPPPRISDAAHRWRLNHLQSL